MIEFIIGLTVTMLVIWLRHLRPSVAPRIIPPAGDTPDTISIEQVLTWLPSSVADDFTCTAGPHRWQELGDRAYCLDCTRIRRRPHDQEARTPHPHPAQAG